MIGIIWSYFKYIFSIVSQIYLVYRIIYKIIIYVTYYLVSKEFEEEEEEEEVIDKINNNNNNNKEKKESWNIYIRRNIHEILINILEGKSYNIILIILCKIYLYFKPQHLYCLYVEKLPENNNIKKEEEEIVLYPLPWIVEKIIDPRIWLSIIIILFFAIFMFYGTSTIITKTTKDIIIRITGEEETIDYDSNKDNNRNIDLYIYGIPSCNNLFMNQTDYSIEKEIRTKENTCIIPLILKENDDNELSILEENEFLYTINYITSSNEYNIKNYVQKWRLEIINNIVPLITTKEEEEEENIPNYFTRHLNNDILLYTKFYNPSMEKFIYKLLSWNMIERFITEWDKLSSLTTETTSCICPSFLGIIESCFFFYSKEDNRWELLFHPDIIKDDIWSNNIDIKTLIGYYNINDTNIKGEEKVNFFKLNKEFMDGKKYLIHSKTLAIQFFQPILKEEEEKKKEIINKEVGDILKEFPDQVIFKKKMNLFKKRLYMSHTACFFHCQEQYNHQK